MNEHNECASFFFIFPLFVFWLFSFLAGHTTVLCSEASDGIVDVDSSRIGPVS